ncbi:MAG: hypothetical protein WDM81_16305 [Rhizomicrobium sp.]
MPRINAMLAIGVVLIVLIFKTSDALAAALWHRGHRRDGDQHLPGRRRRDPPMALAPARRLRGVRRARPGRSRLPVVQHAEGYPGRLAAARHGGDGVRADRHLAHRPPRPIWTICATAPFRSTSSCRRAPAERVAGTAIFLAAPHRCDAGPDAAQPQALSRAA